MNGYIWTTKEGLLLLPREMSIEHLINSVTWLGVNFKPEDIVDEHTVWEWVQYMSMIIINKQIERDEEEEE